MELIYCIIDSLKGIVVAMTKLVVALVLVGVVFASMSSGHTCGDSRLSNLRTNLQSIRAQVELYRLHHNGAYPADIVDGMTRKTDADGTVNESGEFGPYMQEFPGNCFVGDPEEAVKTDGADGEGWCYYPETGAFRANTQGHEEW
jgi:general secretion pathway protein G